MVTGTGGVASPRYLVAIIAAAVDVVGIVGGGIMATPMIVVVVVVIIIMNMMNIMITVGTADVIRMI